MSAARISAGVRGLDEILGGGLITSIEPLHEFKGVLTGYPNYTGKPGKLIDLD